MAKPKVEKDTSERWLLTYSDLMNLLLILFIILYCSSQIDQKKAEQVSESLNKGFSTMAGTASQASGTSGDSELGADVYWAADGYEDFFNEVNDLIKQENLQDQVEAKVDNTGVIISFKDSVLFSTGSATLSEEAQNIIDKIGGLLGNLEFSFILVEGHTDSDPILHGSKFVDNMDLSSARAGNVWRELVSCGLPAENMASIGYGEYRPLVANDTPENKSKNRRVIITILKKPFMPTTDLATDNSTNNNTTG